EVRHRLDRLDDPERLHIGDLGADGRQLNEDHVSEAIGREPRDPHADPAALRARPFMLRWIPQILWVHHTPHETVGKLERWKVEKSTWKLFNSPTLQLFNSSCRTVTSRPGRPPAGLESPPAVGCRGEHRPARHTPCRCSCGST